MAKTETSPTGLRPLYLFDQLVVGAHNQFAVGACQEVLRAPGETYNPLFLYGPPGVGKTHLMQAVAHQMLQQNPSFKIRYISGERFMSEVLTAISEDRMLELRRAYSVLDLLILDDVQYLIESKISQEELFHVFNNMHQANRQVILASDRPPNQLTALNNNIRTRLEWGLSTDVKVPDETTRLTILQRKQQQLPGLNMDDQMLLYVARALNTNVRELEGFLKRIHAYVTLSHQALSLNLVKTVVKEILPEGAPEPVVDLTQQPAPAASAAPAVNSSSNGHHKPAPAPVPVAAAPPPPVAPPPAPVAPVAAPPPPMAPAPVTSTPFVPPLPHAPTAPPIFSPDILKETAPAPVAHVPTSLPPKPPAPSNTTFEVLLESIDQAPPPPPLPATPAPFFGLETEPPQAEAVNFAKASSAPPVPDLKVVMPSASPGAPPPAPVVPDPVMAAPVVAVPVPEMELAAEDDIGIGHKDIGAVFFYPEGADESLETVHRKFQDVIKKHKLKFRLKRTHSEPYAYKGKINYSSFVDVCKNNKVPVAIVIGPPPGGAPQQDFYDLLTVTLDVQGVSLQLVNWGEINKDYRYLNLALDIALVRSR